ncbi:MAG: DUF3108 domain-containing protein [Bacteroidia bacterium]|nr:DUF3108 domain-containing protein [Bacteroidia bacterium]MBT8267897.1 DUF3108 domain-containing protein [Bacteroidia bacterium]NNL80836.1 DUF3108 domain-containing protein [Flavobacteriaceae bacterium]
MRPFLLLLLLLINLPTIAQNKTIGTNEKLVFTASYNMSGLLTDLAQVTMETSEIKTSSSTLLRLKCRAQTYTKWDNFFKINDLYESYVGANSLRPYLYKREINEGGYYKFMQYKYDRKSGQVQSLMRKRAKVGGFYEVKDNLRIGSESIDLVALIYHIRNLDIHKAGNGSSDTFSVLFDSKENPVTITLLGTETIDTAIGEKSCYKLSIALNNSDVLKGKNSNLLWLTADNNKIPVYAKFKVAVGSGELRIKSASGLKHSI